MLRLRCSGLRSYKLFLKRTKYIWKCNERRKRRSDYYYDYSLSNEDYSTDTEAVGQEAFPNSIPWQVQVMGNCGGTIVTQKLGMVQSFETKVFPPRNFVLTFKIVCLDSLNSCDCRSLR